MLNACLKLSSSTNQIPLYIHTQAYPSLSLSLSLSKPKQETPRKQQKPQECESLWLGLATTFFLSLFCFLCCAMAVVEEESFSSILGNDHAALGPKEVPSHHASLNQGPFWAHTHRCESTSTM